MSTIVRSQTMMTKKTRLLDVARRAQVDISTVSRIINNKGKIAPETQARVRKILVELDYKPNRFARRLRAGSGKRQLLGLIIPNLQNPFFAELARGVEDVAYQHDFAVLLCNYDEDPKKQRFYIDVMEAESVDGIILPPIHEDDAAVLKLVQSGVPVVCVDRSFAHAAIDKVEIDNARGAFEAVTHLIQKGHRRIGLISGPRDTSTGRERLSGCKDAHAAAGLPLNPDLVRFGDYKQPSGRTLAAELLSLPDPPSALFVGNNLMTIGALETILERHLVIPDQVAIVGFDDIPLAIAFNPPLTVVRQPAYEVGANAAELMFKRLENPKRPSVSLRLMPELIIRGSS